MGKKTPDREIHSLVESLMVCGILNTGLTCAHKGCDAPTTDGKWCILHREVNLRFYLKLAKERRSP
jgi:hypothetical protein